jgi:hypothetical protein
MAFVTVPKDLNRVKTKVALNLTKRQLICFGSAAAVGVPMFILSRGALGDTGAALLMIGLMLPFFFVAMFEKDGQPAEKVFRNIIRARFYGPRKRPYKTDNLYNALEKEARTIAKNKETAGQAPAAASRAKQKRET